MKKLCCMLLLLCGCGLDTSSAAVREEQPNLIELECGRKVMSFSSAHGESKVLTRAMQDGDKPETLFVDYYVSALNSKMKNTSRISIIESRCR